MVNPFITSEKVNSTAKSEFLQNYSAKTHQRLILGVYELYEPKNAPYGSNFMKFSFFTLKKSKITAKTQDLQNGSAKCDLVSFST